MIRLTIPPYGCYQVLCLDFQERMLGLVIASMIIGHCELTVFAGHAVDVRNDSVAFFDLSVDVGTLIVKVPGPVF